MKAKTMLGFADSETTDLDALTYNLLRPDQSAGQHDHIWRTYLSWLTFTRQVAVSVDAAGKAAKRPAEFQAWWVGLNDDPTHAFFREERNAALKAVVRVICGRVIDAGESGTYVFWTSRTVSTQAIRWFRAASSTTSGFTNRFGLRPVNCCSHGPSRSEKP